MQITGIPEDISRKAYLQLVESLGLDYDQLISLEFGRDSIKAEMFALNPDGERFAHQTADGLRAATHTISIPVREDYVEVVA